MAAGITCHRAKSSGGFYLEPRTFTEPHVAYPRAEASTLENIAKCSELLHQSPADAIYREMLGRELDDLFALRRKP